MVSPLLLMLSQDPLLLRHLGERQRYVPPVLAFSGYLAIATAVQVGPLRVEGCSWASMAIDCTTYKSTCGLLTLLDDPSTLLPGH